MSVPNELPTQVSKCRVSVLTLFALDNIIYILLWRREFDKFNPTTAHAGGAMRSLNGDAIANHYKIITGSLAEQTPLAGPIISNQIRGYHALSITYYGMSSQLPPTYHLARL